MESKSSPSIIAIGAVVAIILGLVMSIMGNPKISGPINYLTTGNGPAGPADFHQVARQDAIDNGIDPNLFERQINEESGWNPNAISPAGAIGIAQFEPQTAKGLGIDPWNAEQSLQGAATLMSRYVAKYGDYSKALSAYNYGSGNTDSAIARCGWNWKSCVPAETQNYITAIMGG